MVDKITSILLHTVVAGGSAAMTVTLAKKNGESSGAAGGDSSSEIPAKTTNLADPGGTGYVPSASGDG